MRQAVSSTWQQLWQQQGYRNSSQQTAARQARFRLQLVEEQEHQQLLLLLMRLALMPS